MADIKTRDVIRGTIKTVDRAAIAERRMKQSCLLTKDKAKQFDKMSEASETEYASKQVEQKTETVAKHVVQRIDQKGRKGFEITRGNIRTRMKRSDEKNKNFLRKHTNGRNDKKVQDDENALNKDFNLMGKKVDKTSKNKASKDIKTAKAPQKPINYIKSTIKDAEQATETTRKTIAASSRVSKGVTQVTKSVTRTITSGAKTVAKATTKAARATMTTAKMSVAAIAAGGWVAIVAIVVICLSTLLLGSVFGIFFAGEDAGTGQTIQTVVREINSDYDDKLMNIRDKSSYDILEMKGSRAVWKEVLAVYSVKVNTDPDNPQEVVTMDEAKKKLLKTIFWDMNNISSRTEDKLETVITETDDGNGNIVQIKNTERRTYLYITVSHKTAYDMASKYGFNQEQREYLDELLSDENNSLWSSVLYGTSGEDNQIVAVALSQAGNVGGRPYWSWYGFNSRVEWCACFVSWCANECGYIETGIIPKYASCVNGVQWFKDRGQWLDGSAEPLPGMIIFYDWDKQGQSGQQDGRADHTGIVWKVENGYVYTIEGNLSDKCMTSRRPIGEYQILGYGVPQY
jgi:hypothetical protein